MGLFDEIGEKITKSGQDLVKRAREVAEAARISGQITEEQRALTTFYAQIGEKYYEAFKDSPHEEFAQSCERIAAGLNRIAELQAEYNRLKNNRICPKCGAAHGRDVNYCGACGAALTQPEPPAEAAPEQPEAEAECACEDCADEVAEAAAEVAEAAAEIAEAAVEAAEAAAEIAEAAASGADCACGCEKAAE